MSGWPIDPLPPALAGKAMFGPDHFGAGDPEPDLSSFLTAETFWYAQIIKGTDVGQVADYVICDGELQGHYLDEIDPATWAVKPADSKTRDGDGNYVVTRGVNYNRCGRQDWPIPFDLGSGGRTYYPIVVVLDREGYAPSESFLAYRFWFPYMMLTAEVVSCTGDLVNTAKWKVTGVTEPIASIQSLVKGYAEATHFWPPAEVGDTIYVAPAYTGVAGRWMDMTPRIPVNTTGTYNAGTDEPLRADGPNHYLYVPGT